MNPYPDDTFLARWLAGELTDEERRAFEASPDFERLSKVLKAMDSLAIPPMDEQGLMTRIRTRIQAEKGKIIRLRRTQISLAIAAGIALLLLGTWAIFRPQPTQIQPLSLKTGMGEQEQALLGEGSEVWVNAASELSFAVEEESGNRQVQLTGEAHFSVSKGDPFQVQTELGDVQVLGTAFTVFAREELLRVSCFEGKVWVQTIPDSNGVVQADTLVKGESVSYRQGLRLEGNAAGSQPSWIEGVIILENATVQEAAAELERQFDVKIELEGIQQTGNRKAIFSKKDLNTAIGEVFGGRVKIDSLGPKHIRLSPLKE